MTLVFVLLQLPSCGGGHGNGDSGRDDSGLTADSDGDGVADDQDLCPGTASDTAVDTGGCSADQPAIDTDDDGVADLQDLCPGTASDTAVDTDGCSADQAAIGGDGIADFAGLLPEHSRGSYG